MLRASETLSTLNLDFLAINLTCYLLICWTWDYVFKLYYLKLRMMTGFQNEAPSLASVAITVIDEHINSQIHCESAVLPNQSLLASHLCWRANTGIRVNQIRTIHSSARMMLLYMETLLGGEINLCLVVTGSFAACLQLLQSSSLLPSWYAVYFRPTIDENHVR